MQAGTSQCNTASASLQCSEQADLTTSLQVVLVLLQLSFAMIGPKDVRGSSTMLEHAPHHDISCHRNICSDPATAATLQTQ